MRSGQLFPLSVPLASTFVTMSAMGFYLTYISLYFSHQGFDNTIIGTIQAAYFLGLFLGTYVLEQLVRRIGHIQVLALSGSLLTSTILAQSLSDSIPLWVASRCVAGFAVASFYVVVECWMLDQTEERERGLCLALYMVALNLGYALGLQLISVIELGSPAAFSAAALLTALSMVPAALSTQRPTVPSSNADIRLPTLIRATPFGSASCLYSGLVLSSLYSFLPVIDRLSQQQGAQLVTWMVIGGLIAQWPLGRLSDLFSRRVVLAGLHSTLCICYMSLSMQHDYSTLSVRVLIFLVGASAVTLYPVGLTQVLDRLPTDRFTKGAASALLLYGGGSVLGPVFSSIAMNLAKASGLWLFLGAGSLSVLSLGVITSLRKRPVPVAEKEPFLAVPGTTVIANEMDPRTDLYEES